MRNLTVEELEFVCGGYDVITVTAPSPPPPPSVPSPTTGQGGSSGSSIPGVNQAVIEVLASHGSQHAVNNSSNHTAAATQAITDLQNALKANVLAAMFHIQDIKMPDGTMLTQSQQLDMLSRIQFEAVDTNFGSNRAGANAIGSDGLIHIQINVIDLIKYDGWPGGYNYLIAHEIAHDTAGGLAESQAMWTAYLKEPGVMAMSDADKVSNYAKSTEFLANEKWANNGALAITKALNETSMPAPLGY